MTLTAFLEANESDLLKCSVGCLVGQWETSSQHLTPHSHPGPEGGMAAWGPVQNAPEKASQGFIFWEDRGEVCAGLPQPLHCK